MNTIFLMYTLFFSFFFAFLAYLFQYLWPSVTLNSRLAPISFIRFHGKWPKQFIKFIVRNVMSDKCRQSNVQSRRCFPKPFLDLYSKTRPRSLDACNSCTPRMHFSISEIVNAFFSSVLAKAAMFSSCFLTMSDLNFSTTSDTGLCNVSPRLSIAGQD